MIENVNIINLPNFPEESRKKIIEILGVIEAISVQGRWDFIEGTIQKLEDWFGGKNSVAEKALKNSMTEAKKKIKELASEKGANAIVGLSSEVDYDENRALAHYIGTAVIFEEE